MSMLQLRSSRQMQGTPVQHSHPRQLRPSNPSTQGATPLRRTVFRSQIPIAARHPSTQTGHVQHQALEQGSRAFQPFSTPQPRPHNMHSAAQHFHATPTTTYQAMRSPGGSTPTVTQSVEMAFTVFGERMQADLRDFRTICVRLMSQEQEDKEKWHTLCLKMMRERDTARQRVHALIGEREARAADTVGSQETSGQRGSKRGREDRTDMVDDVSSRSSSTNSRPIRSMRASPTPLSPGSPSSPTYEPCSPTDPPPTSSCPPTSASMTVPETPTSPEATHNTPALTCLTDFRPPRSPGDTTCFDITTENGTDQRPVKRRKSCETSMSDRSSATLVEPAHGPEHDTVSALGEKDMELESETESSTTAVLDCTRSESGNPLKANTSPIEFSHVDIMYVPLKGNLVCRACLLKKTNPSSSPTPPKSFLTTAAWDDLRDHCIAAHPTACADVARLHPAEIYELRRRLNM
ncbi:hypothetical protein B0H34DRAFT_199743 [Crassisporium funariophilum]|nr:hypothetical protein B0H34DRAFT_199743 [Crassisporium funariophilum]